MDLPDDISLQEQPIHHDRNEGNSTASLPESVLSAFAIPYVAILERMPDACIVLDAQWRIVYVNQQAVSVLFQPPTDLLGHNIWETFPKLHTSPLFSLCQQVKNTGETLSFDYFAPVFNIWFQVSIAAVEEGICIYFRDITERKEMEQSKDHFISMVSHELKTPLTIASAFTQLLQEQFTAEDRQDVLRLLTKVDDQIVKLTQLVVDMLDLSKTQNNQLTLEQKPVDIDALIHEVVENVQPTTSHRVLIEGKAHRSILGDKERLGQVLIILLSNAIKYSPQADSVTVRVTHSNDLLTVSVQDTGIGIALAHQRKLFERFYRVLSKKDQTFPGLGIGLYIAREIIQRHGGKIGVESVEGKGSTFFFSLPMLE